MGTTVTPNLGLIKPDLDESIKEDLPAFVGWAAQNADNMDAIDALFRVTTGTYTLNWTADGGNPVLGTGGFVEGKVVRILPRLVLGYIKIFAGGTGFSAGSGIYRINLPTGIATELSSVNDGIPIGSVTFFDSSAASSSSVFLVTYNPTASNCYFTPPTGGAWSATSPVAMAQNDRISGFFMYPTADA